MLPSSLVPTRSLQDQGESFDATVLEAARAQRIVLFAVGAGGNPERFGPLLAFLSAAGCKVVAPRFARLASHFSFMDVPPPQVTEPLADRDQFLAELRGQTLRFVMG